jgi:hypothetical protein
MTMTVDVCAPLCTHQMAQVREALYDPRFRYAKLRPLLPGEPRLSPERRLCLLAKQMLVPYRRLERSMQDFGFIVPPRWATLVYNKDVIDLKRRYPSRMPVAIEYDDLPKLAEQLFPDGQHALALALLLGIGAPGVCAWMCETLPGTASQLPVSVADRTRRFRAPKTAKRQKLTSEEKAEQRLNQMARCRKLAEKLIPELQVRLFIRTLPGSLPSASRGFRCTVLLSASSTAEAPPVRAPRCLQPPACADAIFSCNRLGSRLQLIIYKHCAKYYIEYLNCCLRLRTPPSFRHAITSSAAKDLRTGRSSSVPVGCRSVQACLTMR